MCSQLTPSVLVIASSLITIVVVSVVCVVASTPSMTQLLDWPLHHFKHLSNLLGCDLAEAASRVIDRLDTTKFSTSFSGIDAPGTALSVLRIFASKCNNANISSGRAHHVYGIEINKTVALELASHPHQPTCLFADIIDFFASPVQELLPELENLGKTASILKPLLKKTSLICGCFSYINSFCCDNCAH